jgi:glycosyltransferase involved in cell wall biosynthesis
VADQHGLTIILLAPASSVHTRRWASALGGGGHRIIVASWTPGEAIPGVEVRVAPAAGSNPAWRLALAHGWLRRLVDDSGADLVHVHSLGVHGLLSLALPAGPARVITPWGSELAAARRSTFRAAVARRALHSADLALPTSSAVAAELTSRYALPPARVRVLSWGVEDALIEMRSRVNASAARAEFGLPADATIVLSCRTTSATYRTRDIVSAFADAATTRRDLFLVLLRGHQPDHAASGRAQDEYMRGIRQLIRGVANRTMLMEDTLEPAQLFRLMRASDLAVSVPASDQRSSSVLEAALAGCRLLLSDIPPYHEMIRDGLAADLVTDPMVTALADLLATVSPYTGSQQRNRRFILSRERAVDKTAVLDGIYRQLARAALPVGKAALPT